jgi:hypothetical protein
MVPLPADIEALQTEFLNKFGPKPNSRENLEAAKKWVNDVEGYLARRTGISDDLFGHWVQALDGRQVIVILDTCFSGGFHDNEIKIEKDLEPPAPPSFDFLDREFSRLKDIGQRDTALLAACGANEKSRLRVDKPISVMTECLLLGLEKLDGPIEMKQAYELCLVRMKAYFDAVRKVKPSYEGHTPVFYADLTHAAYLKP